MNNHSAIPQAVSSQLWLKNTARLSFNLLNPPQIRKSSRTKYDHLSPKTSPTPPSQHYMAQLHTRWYNGQPLTQFLPRSIHTHGRNHYINCPILVEKDIYNMKNVIYNWGLECKTLVPVKINNTLTEVNSLYSTFFTHKTRCINRKTHLTRAQD